MGQTIYASTGAKEMTWPTLVNAPEGVNLGQDIIQAALGTYDTPGEWKIPEVTNPTPSSAAVQLVVDESTPPGTYYMWVKISTAEEALLRRGERVTVK